MGSDDNPLMIKLNQEHQTEKPQEKKAYEPPDGIEPIKHDEYKRM